jgi:hypothetical protein
MASLAILGAEVAQQRELLHKKLDVGFASKLEHLKAVNEKNQETIKLLDTKDPVDVVDIGTKINSLKFDLIAFETAIAAKLDRLSIFISNNSEIIDELDQDRRAKHLIIQGLLESASPVDAVHGLVVKMGVSVPPDPHVFFDAVHRLGKERSAAEVAARGPRPLLVKFNTLSERNSVYNAKKLLKSSKTSISEDIYEKSESFRKYFDIIFLSLLFLK